VLVDGFFGGNLQIGYACGFLVMVSRSVVGVSLAVRAKQLRSAGPNRSYDSTARVCDLELGRGSMIALWTERKKSKGHSRIKKLARCSSALALASRNRAAGQSSNPTSGVDVLKSCQSQYKHSFNLGYLS